MNFDDLAPVDNAEQSEAYLKALRWALGNPKIRNVAVTGPYGSGKSSILETFRKQYENDFKFLNISLASFGDGGTAAAQVAVPDAGGGELSKQAEQRKNEAQQLIELSVLQQIFYKVDQQALPDSRFKRISSLQRSYVVFFVLGVLGVLFGGSLLLFPKRADQLEFLAEFSKAYPDSWHLFLLTLVLPGLIWLIVFMVRFFRTAGLKKLNISSGEIEIDPKSEASILNKYLDELVYFFSATRYNVLLIEDMDRFNDPEIFTKLRELNVLLNSSSQVGRRIVFVYAIKDDLFPDDRTRTKFFDFIVPVIPVVNWSNSLQKLKDKLDGAGFKVEPRFVTSITLYIDDMRVLKNIFNELMLYKEALDIPAERQTKLLAMIAYKNIYPNDFADLHQEKGTVHAILIKAQEVRGKILAELDGKIVLQEKFITDTEALVPINITELRSPYIFKIVDQLVNFTYFRQDNSRQTFAEVMADDWFKVIVAGKNVPYYSNTGGNLQANYKFADIEAAVAPGQTYTEREKMVRSKSEAGLAKIRKEMAVLVGEKDKVKAYTIAEIIRKQPDEFPDIVETNKDNLLMRYLLAEGYIDLSYPYLISYFYPGAIGRADMKFLTYTNDRITLPFDYELEKPAGLIEMFAAYDFEREQILNVSLLDTLLQHRHQYKIEGDRLLAQLNTGSALGLEFIEVYLKQGKQVSLFVRLLCKSWPGVFSYYVEDEHGEEQEKWLELILCHADVDDLPALNENDVLRVAIESRFERLAAVFKKLAVNRGVAILKTLSAKFWSLRADEDTKALFELAYAGDRYDLTTENIAVILAAKNSGAIAEDGLATANYTTILDSDCDNLLGYVQSEISTYVDKVLLELPDAQNDKPSYLVDLLNDEDLEVPQKTAIIKKENVVLDDISEVDNADLYPALLQYKKVAPVWANVTHYSSDEVDEVMLDYLNIVNHAKALGDEKLTARAALDQAATNEFELKVIMANGLKLETYRELLRAFRPGYESLKTSALSKDKVLALINQKLLYVIPAMFEEVKTNHPPLQVDLLSSNADKFLETFSEFILDAGDYAALLAPGKMLPAEQLRLIGLIPDDILQSSRPLASRSLQLLVAAKQLEMDEDRLLVLITIADRVQDKLVLLDHHLAALDISVIRQLLNGIGGDFASLNKGKRPKMNLNELTESLALKLENKHIISSSRINIEKGIIRLIGRG